MLHQLHQGLTMEMTSWASGRDVSTPSLMDSSTAVVQAWCISPDFSYMSKLVRTVESWPLTEI